MSIEITKFRKMSSKSLYGFCNVKIPAWHMEIIDISVFYRQGEFSFALPSKQFKKEDGTTGYQTLVKLDDVAYKSFMSSMKRVFSDYIESQNLGEEPQSNQFEEELPF